MITPEQLKIIRIRLNLEQLQFAEKLGLSRQLVSDMERGVKPISQATEIKLKELGYVTEQETSPPDWLKNLTEEEELFLQNLIEHDKELFTLFKYACAGNKEKIELLTDYLKRKCNITD